MKGARVLVARQDSMGDVLLAGPAVRAVAANAAHLTFLSGPRGSAAARMLPGVDSVIEWDSPWIADPAPAMTRSHADRLEDLLEQERPDQAIILTSFHQSPLPMALLLRLHGISPITAASVDYSGSLLDVRLRPGEALPEDLPEPLRALAIVEAAGFLLPPGDNGRLAVRSVPPLHPFRPARPYVVIHPGADAPARTWPATAHREAAALLARHGHSVVVTGTAEEARLTSMVAGGTALDLGGLLDLPALAAVLSGADAVVVGNTGPAHLAAAVGTPVVSLFSPVVPPIKWAPYGVAVELLGNQQALCRNSRARICPVPGHPCLSSVTPQDVLEAVERLVDSPGKVAS
jgi:ADP-heptose:LPS heptosyltransferase